LQGVNVMTFENWLEAVDKAFIKIVGLDRDSWPDQDYWSMWDAGDTPIEAVIAAIENEYGEEGLEAFGLETA
jgi:hypothetical protein